METMGEINIISWVQFASGTGLLELVLAMGLFWNPPPKKKKKFPLVFEASSLSSTVDHKCIWSLYFVRNRYELL